MRRAMAEAEVGDDVFLEDPTINRLQERAAAVFGREAALFVPSGSMGNLTSVIAHIRPGQEVVCEATAAASDSGKTTPPARLWVFSTTTSVVGG